eukprot:6174356-Pleurochrysis_carterae.AAC.2
MLNACAARSLLARSAQLDVVVFRGRAERVPVWLRSRRAAEHHAQPVAAAGRRVLGRAQHVHAKHQHQ